jgi:hypothetical protein
MIPHTYTMSHASRKSKVAVTFCGVWFFSFFCLGSCDHDPGVELGINIYPVTRYLSRHWRRSPVVPVLCVAFSPCSVSGLVRLYSSCGDGLESPCLVLIFRVSFDAGYTVRLGIAGRMVVHSANHPSIIQSSSLLGFSARVPTGSRFRLLLPQSFNQSNPAVEISHVYIYVRFVT